jgi:hypothetical protein
MVTISVTQLKRFLVWSDYINDSVRRVSCLMVTMSMTLGSFLFDDNYICDSVGKFLA